MSMKVTGDPAIDTLLTSLNGADVLFILFPEQCGLIAEMNPEKENAPKLVFPDMVKTEYWNKKQRDSYFRFLRKKLHEENLFPGKVSDYINDLGDDYKYLFQR